LYIYFFLKNMRILFVFIFYIIISCSYSQEICNDGIDNNNNGLIDMNDPECFCSGILFNTNVPSLIPNHSFELMNCCPVYPSQMLCATDWIQATSATTDYINTCGLVPQAAINAGLVPFPDGNGIVGAIYQINWSEYAGTCLTAPLLAGNTYVLTFYIASTPINGYGQVCNNGIIYYSPINVTIYGSTNCAYMPLSTTTCPSVASPNWYVLSAKNYTPISQWQEITFIFTPTANINAIMIGAPCTLPSIYDSLACHPYFYYDGLVLNERSFFSLLSIIQTGNYCSNDLVLTSQIDTNGGVWQWYLNGIALIGETDSVLDVSGNAYGVGLYTVSYSIQGVCQSDYFEVVDDTPIITLSASLDSICPGNFVALIVSGADSYLWSNSSASSFIIVNPAITTTYSVTGTNNFGCYSLDTITITVNNLFMNTSALPNSICLGAATTLTASGADSYLWSNLSTDSIITVNPTTTTTYTVTGTNIYGCSGLDTIIITVNDVTLNTSAIPDSICLGSSSTLSVSGAHSYLWSNLSTDSIITVNPTTTTIYTVTGTNIYGCSGLDTIIITVNDVTLNTSAIPDSICLGSSSTLSVSGADSYLWSNLSTDSIIIVNPTTTTTYSVTGTNNYGCSHIDTIIVIVNSNVVLSTSAIPDSICLGASSTLTVSGADSYLWSNSSTDSIITVNPMTTTTYTVTGTNNYGCSDISNIIIVIEPNPTISIQSNGPICIGDKIQLQASGGTHYIWSGPNMFTSSLQNPYIDNSNILHAGVYTVTVSNSANCKTIDSLAFEFKDNDIDIITPNVFTPNGDGINDLFEIKTNSDAIVFNCLIYNRWGKLVFEFNNLNNGWNGTIKNTPAGEGVYYFIIKGKNDCNNEFEQYGFVTLFR